MNLKDNYKNFNDLKADAKADGYNSSETTIIAKNGSCILFNEDKYITDIDNLNALEVIKNFYDKNQNQKLIGYIFYNNENTKYTTMFIFDEDKKEYIKCEISRNWWKQAPKF